MTTFAVLAVFFAFVFASLYYVYKLRGTERFEDFNEYVRKGWPIFSPFNCILYLFTKKRARKSIMTVEDFPELKEIQENWSTIREEAYSLYQSGAFEQTKDPEADSYYDIGFRTFYKYGWSKYYVKWYGAQHKSALKSCPKTVEILDRIPSVNGAMFSLLPVGSKLTRHLDPVACSLRYHLGLSTPNQNECYISVDGTSYSWRDGEAFLFDETYLHFAKNNSEKDRLILMCDVERPLFLVGSLVNLFYKVLMRMTVVPNTPEDPRGLANTIYAKLAPILLKTKSLKQTNRGMYLLLKHSVNFTLLLIVIALVVGLVNATIYFV